MNVLCWSSIIVLKGVSGFECFMSQPGGGTQLFCGVYVPRGFPKVGSSERVFLEKLGVLGSENSEIFRLES